jgi:hypothetical protein
MPPDQDVEFTIELTIQYCTYLQVAKQDDTQGVS